MKALYEISQDYQNVISQLEENGGELTDELKAELDRIDGDAEAKIEHVALAIRQKEAEAEVVGKECERLQGRGRSIRNQIDSLKQYLHMNLSVLEKPKVKTPLITVWLQKNAPALEIVNPDEIPMSYKIATLKINPAYLTPSQIAQADIADNKTAILKAMKEGVVVPGVQFAPEKFSLRIK
jgi:hypothetical protein